MEQDNYAYITLATDDNYAGGAMVLGHSLRRVQTLHKLVALITPGVSPSFQSKLRNVYDIVRDVNVMDSKDEANLSLMMRPELGVTLTKLHCWTLTQFTKGVFLDADTMVLQNCDELFERDELSAVPDIGWPDCFNSGVFVFKPSKETFDQLLKTAVEKGSFDGGDQGLLNTFFNDWATKDIAKHLSFIYNMNTSSSYTYLPAYEQFGKDVKIVHFMGSSKPWMQLYDKETGLLETSENCHHLLEHLQMWWEIYLAHYDDIPAEESELSAEVSQLEIKPTESSSSPAGTSSPSKNIPDENRQHSWEQGHIDYLGIDSFDNIERKLDEVINGSKK